MSPPWPPDSKEWREERLHYIDGTNAYGSGHQSIDGRMMNRIAAAKKMHSIEVALGYP